MARTSYGLPGIYNSSDFTLSSGDGSALTTDAAGRLQLSGLDITNTVFPVQFKPVAVSTYSWTSFQNLGANATLNVKATPGNVRSLYCHNIGGTAAYIQLHNSATTSSGAPLYTFLVPAGGTTFVESTFFGENGAYFSTGIAFGFSTTEATYTAGNAANQITQIMYI